MPLLPIESSSGNREIATMSGVLTKLWTALRGAANEAGEAAVDVNATRILDQEIRDADNELREARIALAGMMGKQSVEQTHLAEKQAKLEEYAGYLRQTLARQQAAAKSGQSAEAAKHDGLAQEIAAKYAEQEALIKASSSVIAEYEKSIATLKQKITAGEAAIRTLKQRADTVKAKQHVIRASAAVAAASSGTDTHARSALDSLERIERRQEEALAQMDAANSLASEASGEALEERLRRAGIIPGASAASDVIARFKHDDSKPDGSATQA
jgi:phage shock protein A